MKVLILGLAKSGTTALAYKVHEALGDGATLNFEPGKSAGAEDRALHLELTAREGDAVTKNLVFPTTETRWEDIFQNAGLYDRAIWIVRDPRDIIISNFFYHWFQGHKASQEKFEDALARTRRKESDPSGTAFIDLVAGTMTESRAQLAAWQTSWYDILGDAARGITAHMHVMRYEDFVDSKFESINAYLGLDLAGETEVPDAHRRVVRTRGYGNWRRWFTREDVDFFRPIFGRFLDTMGYDADDWALTPVESLPATEGSAYMEKVHRSGKQGSGRGLLARLLARLKAIR